MLELYEQNRLVQPSHGNNEADESSCAGTNHPTGINSTVSESSASVNGRQGAQPTPQTRPLVAQQSNADGDRAGSRSARSHSNDHGSADSKSGIWDHNMDGNGKDNSYHEAELVSRSRDSTAEGHSSSKLFNSDFLSDETAKCMETVTKIDKDKVKAALEKTRRFRNDATKKNEIVDDDDLIERELENGIELAVDDKRQGWPKAVVHPGQQHAMPAIMRRKHLNSENVNVNRRIQDELFAEEGELSSLDEHDHPSRLQGHNNGKVSGGKRRPDEKMWSSDFSDRDHKRVRGKLD